MYSNKIRKKSTVAIMTFSKKDVVRAGEALIKDGLLDDPQLLDQTMEVLTYWRDSHIMPLNAAHELLNRFIHRIDKKAFIAKRLKRFESIKRKLKRFDGMQLKNMQDIGGVRVVVSNLKQVDSIYKILANEYCFYNGSNFIKMDNYILQPKTDGYRSLHIVGKFNNESSDERKIEFQIRTKLQHSWATTLEIVDIFTGQNLKSDDGFYDYKKFFKDVSDQFQIIENLQGFISDNKAQLTKEYLTKVIQNQQLIRQCVSIKNFVDRGDGTITVEKQFSVYCSSLNDLNKGIVAKKYTEGLVLIRLNVQTGKIEDEFFKKSEQTLASQRYSQYEQLLSKDKKWIVALLSTNAIGGLKEAYPNYFADSEIFLSYIGLIKIAATLGSVQRIKQMYT
ncbi:RelA/SpoT domain-containing protein [Acinetobacter sp. NIPH 2699]|uniref:RelA/SpoT domain-containing protein n=1 Tax=Acinetobacter sp. NIPH 2699 TaxID=2923433 RepID=UPI001F4B5DDD|nr:RelA/SpoT domain-containing protein [Acinetobacter sp. NIPH 2699]MCH7336682.1 RelA/SpoT domain-containing protein [Acinetobacter sp. NIPH 2699]